MGPKVVAEAPDAPRAPGCRERRAERRSPADRHHRPRHGVAHGDLAADDRRHPLRRVRPAADLDHLHAAQPLPRDPGGEAGVPEGRERAGPHLREVADRRPGPAERVLQVQGEDRAARRQPPGAVPGRHVSFNTAQGVSLGDATTAIRRPRPSSGCRRASTRSSRGRPRRSTRRSGASRCSSSPRSSRSTSCSACSTRATSTRSRSSRRCRPPESAPSSRSWCAAPSSASSRSSASCSSSAS